MTTRPLRVCLIQHSTRSDNLGVGALTVSEIALLREVASEIGRELEITIVDAKDARPSYVEGDDIRVVDLDRDLMLSPKGFFALARNSDAVIDVGAGDSFADIYGTRRLRRMFLLKALAHLAGTPVIMAPQTIGPFTKGASRRLAKSTMRRSALVASRDRLSTEAARGMGIDKVIEASDLALRLPYERPAPRDPEAKPKVGLNVSGLLMMGGYSGANDFGIKGDYPELVRALIRFFQAEGAEVHIVAHVLPETAERSHPEDDTRASAALKEEFPDLVEAPRFFSPSEAKSYIAGLDFFMGARMHACIAAFSAGVPVVPMAYSRKFAGLFGSLGYDRTVDCTAEEPEAIRTKIEAAWRDRDTLKSEVDDACARGLEKLSVYQDALKGVLAATR